MIAFRRFASSVTLLFLVGVFSVHAQPDTSGPSVLIVTAHPDDDAAFAATVYKITHDLNGSVDLALITDGSGGYRYSTLAEPIYGLNLTDESVARTHLPAIRKQELMAGGKIMGLRNYFFLDQLDHAYTLNADTVLTYVWDTEAVKTRLHQIMTKGNYDFIFTLLPTEGTHGHHKSAGILALETTQMLDPSARPIVLGSFPSSKEGDPMTYTGLPDYPITRVEGGEPLAVFDRTQPFGFRDRLNYNIIVNWVIAEHKSQGTMQLFMNQVDVENFWFFAANAPEATDKVVALFDQLAK